MPRQTIIHAGWLVDGSGGPIARAALLRLENGRIRSVETGVRRDRGEAAGRPGVTEVDLSDCTVLPGLVDAHVHLFMSGTDDERQRRAQLTAGFRDACRTIAGHLGRHLAWGVTAVRDGGDRQGHVLRYKSQVAGACGVGSGTDVKSSGRAWKAAGRYGRMIGRSPEEGMDLAQAIAADREPVDQVKIVNSGLNSLIAYGRETAPQFGQQEMTAAVRAAAGKGLPTMVHANGRQPVAVSLAAGCRSVEHGYFMGIDNLQRMADTQTFWVPTLLPMKAYADDPRQEALRREVALKTLEHQIGQVASARRLGVPVALGTDAGSMGVHHGRGVAMELRLLMQAGYRLSEAVGCAAGNGSRLLGLDRRGLLTGGMRATLIAVAGGPEQLPESLGRVVRVFIDGADAWPAE